MMQKELGGPRGRRRSRFQVPGTCFLFLSTLLLGLSPFGLQAQDQDAMEAAELATLKGDQDSLESDGISADIFKGGQEGKKGSRTLEDELDAPLEDDSPGPSGFELSSKDDDADFLQEDVLSSTNPLSGVRDSFHEASKDSLRHTFQLGVRGLSMSPLELVGFEYMLAKNLSVLWLEASVSYTLTQFDSIAETPQNSGNPNPYAESNFPRPKDAKQTLLILGLGPAGRFKFPSSLNIFNMQHLYQTTSAQLTYVDLNEGHRSLQYQGWGLRADYGVHKRLGIRSHIGPKISYHFAIVKRGKEREDDPQRDRQLFLSWVSFAIDYSVYF